MNTEFCYSYRDTGQSMRVVLQGTLTDGEKYRIHLACCHGGVDFIPNLVGLPMLSPPVEEWSDEDTLWHSLTVPTMHNVDDEPEGRWADSVTPCSARTVYASFSAILQHDGWNCAEAAKLRVRQEKPIEKPPLGKPDDLLLGTPADVAGQPLLPRFTHVALITKGDLGPLRAAGESKDWLFLRAPEGRTAAQTLVAQHRTLLGTGGSESHLEEILLLELKSAEAFDLGGYYHRLRAFLATKKEATERQHLRNILAQSPGLRDLLARYPGEIKASAAEAETGTRHASDIGPEVVAEAMSGGPRGRQADKVICDDVADDTPPRGSPRIS